MRYEESESEVASPHQRWVAARWRGCARFHSPWGLIPRPFVLRPCGDLAQVPYKALPLELLADDEAAATARKKAGLPEPVAVDEAESGRANAWPPSPSTCAARGCPLEAAGVAIGTASPRAIGLV